MEKEFRRERERERERESRRHMNKIKGDRAKVTHMRIEGRGGGWREKIYLKAHGSQFELGYS